MGTGRYSEGLVLGQFVSQCLECFAPYLTLLGLRINFRLIVSTAFREVSLVSGLYFLKVSHPLAFLHFLDYGIEWIDLSSFLFAKLAEIIVSYQPIGISVQMFEYISYLLPRELDLELVYHKREVSKGDLTRGSDVKEPESSSHFPESLIYLVTEHLDTILETWVNKRSLRVF